MRDTLKKKPYTKLGLRIYRGSIPRRAHNLVLEWADAHRAELMENWQRATRNEPLQPIEPLE